MTKTLSFTVPSEIVKQLDAVAARKGVSRSKYIRDALITHLDREENEPSLYELMKDGIGCIDSGKTDMATNPKYMKGFGKWRK